MTYKTDISHERLRRGALLGTIAHAIWTVHYPFFASEQSWDGRVYLLNNSMGASGAVAFSDQQAVGVFFEGEIAGESLALESIFRGMPLERDDLKDEALQHMHQDVDGESRPLVTAAFWTDCGCVVAAEPWEEVYRNGAHLLRIQLMSPEQAYEAWKENYEFSPFQVDLLKDLYEKRLQHDGPITLEEDEVRRLTDGGNEGLDQAVDLFEDIGMGFP